MESNLIPGKVREYFIKGSRKIKKITPNNDYTLVKFLVPQGKSNKFPEASSLEY